MNNELATYLEITSSKGAKKLISFLATLEIDTKIWRAKMKSWRPEGWENPYPEYPDLSCQKQTEEWLLYEDGADALLELLKQEGFKVSKGQIADPIGSTYVRNGWIVFIPKEEEG